MPALITASDLSVLAGQPVTDAQFATIYRQALALVRREYRADPEITVGHTWDVLSSVVLSAAMRILSNPTGARSVGLASANVTFGGSDESITAPLALTPDERRAIRALKGKAYSVTLLLPGEL